MALDEVGDGGMLALEDVGDGGTRSAGCEYEGARRDEEGVRGSVCDVVVDITATTRLYAANAAGTQNGQSHAQPDAR